MNDTPLPRSARAVPLRPSACPGLMRIVTALDGGICRVKLPAGRLSSAQARQLAQAAARAASGVVEATNRANLQIRGVRPAAEAELIDSLLAAGLGAQSPAADDVRNLMVSPLAGLDPATAFDSRPLAARLLRLLEERPSLHQLSAKFALLLDGGEALAMREHPHDLWLAATDNSATPLLAFGLAGCPSPEATLAWLPEAHAEELVIAVLELFLQRARPDQTRMRQLLAELPVAQFMTQLAARLSFALLLGQPWALPVSSRNGHIGIYPQRQAGLVAVGAAIPLGRLHAEQLLGLADISERLGADGLRFTPWQSVALVNVPAADAPRLQGELRALGLLDDSRAALAHLLACSGSSGCAKGLADTKGDALLLAADLQQRGLAPDVHLSACSRSCAAAHRADYTLLATAAGHYDLYRRDASQPGFGRLHARHLTIAQAGAQLDGDLRSHLDD